MLDSKQIVYFKEVVDSGSISAAARVLGIAQPSLTNQIRNLENYLGRDLLVRSAKGVEMTDAGQALFDCCPQILEGLKAAEEAVHASGVAPVGRVVFGLPTSVAAAISVPLAETVRLELDGVNLRVVEAMSGHIKEWLQSGAIDIGVVYDLEGLRRVHSRIRKPPVKAACRGVS